MHITMVTLFSSTEHEKAHTDTLVYLLNKFIDSNTNQKIIAFDGCGVTYGISGNIFGIGLDEQCQEVIEQVEDDIKKGNTVSLNVYGHSRGGIAGLMLAKQLSCINPSLLEINLVLLDPVPGNLITTATLDPFEITLAKKTMDLRMCKPLRNILSLYPYKPLSALDFHAPLFSLYPEHTKAEEEIIAGCHAEAQFQDCYDDAILFKRVSFITFARVYQFLKNSGCQFKTFPRLIIEELPLLDINIDQIDQALEIVYRSENEIDHKKIIEIVIQLKASVFIQKIRLLFLIYIINA